MLQSISTLIQMFGQVFKTIFQNKSERDDEQMETNSENSLLNTSISRWLNQSIDEDSFHYPIRNESALINMCPNETWIDCMKFLNRDDLQTLQLVANKFVLMVDKYFGIYPLRKVNRCKVKGKKRNSIEILLICLTSGRTIETDSELDLWLQHCYVECIEFQNYNFVNSSMLDFIQFDPRIISINYCVLEYTKRAIEAPITKELLCSLFQIPCLKNCFGAVFSFKKRCSTFQPSLGILLSLPQKSLIIDLTGYKLNETDYITISNWLNGLSPQSSGRNESNFLSLRNLNININSVVAFIDVLRKDFINSTHKKHYILDIHWEEDNWEIGWELEDRDITTTIANSVTGELFTVKAKDKVQIIRQ